MTSRAFIDTNIFIYAIDRKDKHKNRLSRRRLIEIEREGKGVISTQIIQEFYVTATKKLGIEARVAKQQVEKLASFEVVDIDVGLIKEAVDCSILNQLSFWDALVIACAQKAGCDSVLTEDLSHGRMIKSVKVENIFRGHPA